MRIQSHNISMESTHSFHQEMSMSNMSFESFMQGSKQSDSLYASEDEAMKTVELQKQRDEAQVKAENVKDTAISDVFDLSSTPDKFSVNSMRSISEIASSLMDGLKEHSGSEDFRSFMDDKGKMFERRMTFTQTYMESESYSFSTAGKINTDMGSYDINVNFSMTRSFMIENKVSMYQSMDPLVINMDGAVGDLESDSFSFDLDNDGKKDQISTLSENSGFLALDKNNNGKIDQGSELFGTKTGDGFAELAEYDEDGNNWIDEADSIFDSLRIWLKNSQDDDGELIGLGEGGVGAIYLGSNEADYTYKTALNETLGDLKSSGIYLKDDGTVGNISQIDFALRQEQEVQKGEKTSPLSQLLQA